MLRVYIKKTPIVVYLSSEETVGLFLSFDISVTISAVVPLAIAIANDIPN